MLAVHALGRATILAPRARLFHASRVAGGASCCGPTSGSPLGTGRVGGINDASSKKLHGSAITSDQMSDSKIKEALDAFISEENNKEEKKVKKFSPQTIERLRGSDVDAEDLLAGNRAWVEKMNREKPGFFDKLGQKQVPQYLYVGCSDARVDPSRLMGLDMGKLFVHRNIGNVVSGNDLNLLSVIDFSVNHLKVPHILVVGHYDCGAVRGSIGEPEDGGLGIVENWLRNIRDVARFHRDSLLSIKDQEARHRKLVELNVQEQCLNIMKIGTVQRKRLTTFVKEGYALPRVHGLVFDPANGILNKLPLDFKSLIKEDRTIYDLYRLPEWLNRGENKPKLNDE